VVEKTKAVPVCSLSRFMREMMVREVSLSRFAVGSSARTSLGSVTKARAMATRCFWPRRAGRASYLCAPSSPRPPGAPAPSVSFALEARS
jgi:hypothetical protein